MGGGNLSCNFYFQLSPKKYTEKKFLLHYRNFLAAKLPENIRSATENICLQNFPVTKQYRKYSCRTDIFSISKYVKLKRKVKPTYPTRIRTWHAGTGTRRSATRMNCDLLQFSYQDVHYQKRKKLLSTDAICISGNRFYPLAENMYILTN